MGGQGIGNSRESGVGGVGGAGEEKGGWQEF